MKKLFSRARAAIKHEANEWRESVKLDMPSRTPRLDQFISAASPFGVGAVIGLIAVMIGDAFFW